MLGDWRNIAALRDARSTQKRLALHYTRYLLIISLSFFLSLSLSHRSVLCVCVSDLLHRILRINWHPTHQTGIPSIPLINPATATNFRARMEFCCDTVQQMVFSSEIRRSFSWCWSSQYHDKVKRRRSYPERSTPHFKRWVGFLLNAGKNYRKLVWVSLQGLTYNDFRDNLL